ncbi:MAG: DUF3365 domain-containing protein [Arcobacteraceae bacterium]|nr:DUF3365 domain-containing protein [Arcobacteraceae bacterium]
MKKLLLFLIFSFVILNANEKIPYKLAKIKASHVAHNFHKLMKSNAQQKFKEGGTLLAAQFCTDNAVKLTKEFNNKLEKGISLKRISLKNRNSNSYPKEDEINILKALDLLEKSSVYLPKIIQMVDKDIFKVYFPATMSGKSCKKCHGLKKDIDLKVLKLFKDKYPKDKAMNFKSGQVRGAVVVTVKIKD